MSYTQLPQGLFGNNKKQIKLTLPTNYKSEVLFSQLPYLANLKDPIFQASLTEVLKNREDLQEYLLAAGDLNESLDLVVTNGHLNDATVRHEKNMNPLDIVYGNIAKFVARNPIIGSLLTQIESSKITSKVSKKTFDKARNIKDILLQERLNRLKK